MVPQRDLCTKQQFCQPDTPLIESEDEMQERFIKYRKNKVVNIANIGLVMELVGIEFSLVGENPDNRSYLVEPEYEQEWRDRFDLNDGKPQGEIPF
jgi:adenine-specific DNA methylase